MRIDRSFVKTGWPSKLRWPRIVSALTRSDRVFRFKIGLTDSPSTRKNGHGGYDDMVIVYESSSRKNAKKVEDDLIVLYKDWCDGRCDNGRRGRAGRNSAGSRQYVYIVRRKA